MPRETMIVFIQKSLIAAACTAAIGAGASMIMMLLNHDKMLTLLDYKVTVIMNHVAPEVSQNR